MSPTKRVFNAGSSAKRQKVMFKSPRDKSPWRRASVGVMSVNKFQPAPKQEAKFIDTTVTMPGTGVTTGVLTLVNSTVQGTSSIARVGNRIHMKSMLLRLNLAVVSPTSASTRIRCLVVYDKESNGAAPAATDILQADTNCAPNNLYRPGRFITLIDEYLEPQNGTAVGYFLNRYVKLGLPVLYNSGNAGTIADFSAGSVYVLINSNGMAYTSIGGNTYSRIRFTDA
jgi:hypothetical protein